MEEFTTLLLEDYRRNRRIDRPGRICCPGVEAVAELTEKLRLLLLPGYFGQRHICGSYDSYISMEMADVLFRLENLALPLADVDCRAFLRQLPAIRAILEQDLEAFLLGDPAVTEPEEVIISYPGFYAILVQRLAHGLHSLGVPVLPRMMTELAHSRTGIDIHPGAALGPSFFIDHGTGVVIGETTVIGAGVRIYQGVTLGALSTKNAPALRGKKRHPTLEDGVTVYAGASILGGDTVIGKNAVIGANAFVTGSVEPGATVIGHRGPA